MLSVCAITVISHFCVNMLKAIFFILSLFSTASVAFGYLSLPEPRSEEETLLVRRIADFWKDKEYDFVQAEIRAHLDANPDSPFHEQFYAMLGDIAMHNQSYFEALKLYEELSSDRMIAHIKLKKWQALYHLKLFTQLYLETSNSGDDLCDEGKFYFAESAFREALTLLDYPDGQEKAGMLFNQALSIYEVLQHNITFRSHARLAMAEIFRLLGRPQEAADLYLKIAKEGQDEEILFHAAVLLTQCNVAKAEDLFKKIAVGENKRSEAAAFQWLQLLANSEKWSEIEAHRRFFLTQLKEDQLGIAYFYLGMIAFENKNYAQALLDLKKCGLHEKTALLALLKCAQEEGKIDICQTTLDLISAHCPEMLDEANFLMALALGSSGEIEEAIALYEALIESNDENLLSEKARVEKIRLLKANQAWSVAHSEAIEFLQKFPHSDKKVEVCKFAIDLTLSRLAEEELYSQLIEDIQRGIQAGIFHPDELEVQNHHLAKAFLKLNQAEKALEILHSLPSPDPLLLTQCYILLENHDKDIILYGEKALKLDPENSTLHLHLFNAYLKLSEENPKITEQAAEHLCAAMKKFQISLENKLWLAHHYNQRDDQRAIGILETIIDTDERLKRFDGEALVLGELYLKKGRTEKAKELLEKIIVLGKPTQPKAQLLLANLYEQRKNNQEALKLYQIVALTHDLGLAYRAQLEAARILFHQEPDKSLKKLEEIAVKKTLQSEPAHLEAALDYAELKASLLPQKDRNKALLTNLLKIKETFTIQNDIWSKDYHASRKLFPEKDLVYQAYMRYLEARIFLLQSYLTRDKKEGKAKLQAAKALFSSVRQGKYAVTGYLVEKAAMGIHE